MGYKHITLWVAIRSVLIALTSLLLVVVWQTDYMPVTIATIAFAWVAQVALLTRYIHRFTTDINRFFSAMRYQDMSLRFDDTVEKAFPFYQKMNQLMHEFRLVRREKEEERQLREIALEQALAGILLISQSDMVDYANREALRLLGKISVKKLTELPNNLGEELAALPIGSRRVVAATINGQQRKLSVRKTGLTIGGVSHTLISLADIEQELSQTEVDTWNKLIRVLTHEMVNSIKPITMLSASLTEEWTEVASSATAASTAIPSNQITDLTEALEAISTRSQSLNRYVENFKNLTLPKQPDLSTFPVKGVFERVKTALDSNINQENAEVTITLTNNSLSLTADMLLVEQLLITLLRNALDAPCISHPKCIALGATQTDESIHITVTDNGTGIAPEVMEHIFTPFFTTKANGSGIGLSIAKSIMQLHGGSISCRSEDGCTEFLLVFGV